MNGVHDMGGMDGFGAVEPEPNEPTFHQDWESRVMAMVRVMGANGALNIDPPPHGGDASGGREPCGPFD